MERRVRTKYGTIARVNWHRDGLVGVTHLTDSPEGYAFKGLSNVYREDEVEWLEGSEEPSLSDLRSLSDDELREQLLALRRQRRQMQPRRAVVQRPRKDPAQELREAIQQLTPEQRQLLRQLLSGGKGGESGV